MVEVKIRKAQVGRINTKLDVHVEGDTLDIFATMVEFENMVFTVLESLEEKTGLDIHEAFIESLAERFEE